MLYNLSDPLQRESARIKFEHFLKQGKVIQLQTKRKPRSLPQNSYLHLLLQYFATQSGCETEWVKREYYKRAANAEIFLTYRQDPLVGRREHLRSSSTLSAKEMQLSIDRFKVWAVQVAGIYLPDATNEAQLAAAQIAVERAKEYI